MPIIVSVASFCLSLTTKLLGLAMIVYEFKIKAKEYQYRAIIGTSHFIQNKCLRYLLDEK